MRQRTWFLQTTGRLFRRTKRSVTGAFCQPRPPQTSLRWFPFLDLAPDQSIRVSFKGRADFPQRSRFRMPGQAHLSLDDTALRFPPGKSSASQSCTSRNSANQFFILGPNAKSQAFGKCNASPGSAKPELIDLEQAILYPFRSLAVLLFI
jgi:hypothetical protein